MNNIPGLDGFGIREYEQASIRDFVTNHRHLFGGCRVLDFGCGTPETSNQVMPYKQLVESSGGNYYGYDPGLGHASNIWLRGPYETVLCTQVLQMVTDPLHTLKRIRQSIGIGGHLILTYPTTWPVLATESDLWRFTDKGMTQMLTQAGFQVLETVERGRIEIPGWPIVLGYGQIARVPE